jgi:hypothetical protein
MATFASARTTSRLTGAPGSPIRIAERDLIAFVSAGCVESANDHILVPLLRRHAADVSACRGNSVEKVIV